LEIEIDEHSTLPEEAARRFALYSRSKRAVRQITSRIADVRPELEILNSQSEALEKIIAERDEAGIEKFTAKKSAPIVRGSKIEKRFPARVVIFLQMGLKFWWAGRRATMTI